MGGEGGMLRAAQRCALGRELLAAFEPLCKFADRWAKRR